MKAQTTAVLACVVVFAMVFASASAITYSWWSDSEEADITVTTGYIELDAKPVAKLIRGQSSSDISINYSNTNGISESTIDDIIMIPGDKLVLTYNGTLSTTIDTIFSIATTVSGPFDVDERVSIKNDIKSYNQTEKIPVADINPMVVEGTITFTLPSNIGNEWMNQTFALGAILGVYQFNIDAGAIPSDSVSKTIVADGTNDVTISNNNTTVKIAGLKGSDENKTADVTILNGFTNDGYVAVGDEGSFVAGLSVEFEEGNQVGNAAVSITLDGNYSSAGENITGGLKEGFSINHVDDGVSTSVTGVSAVYDGTKTIITFNATSFSEYYLIDERAIQDEDGEMYTLPQAFKIGGKIGGEMTLEMTLTRDISGPGAVLPSGSNVILDLNGFTYTFNKDPVGSEGTESQCLQLLKDSTITIKNGTLAVDTDSGKVNFKMFIQNYSNLTLENVTVDGRGLLGTNANYVISNNCGDSEFSGNTKIIADAGDFAFDVYDYSSAGYTILPTVTVKPTVIVNGAIEAAAKIGNVYYSTLVDAIEATENGDVVTMLVDYTGNITVEQKPDVKITLDGDGKKFAGIIIVDGKSSTYTTAGLTIKDIDFEAKTIEKDACINLGNGSNATRYTCNVTVDGCTFDVHGAVGVKSYTGGDKNLTIIGCTVEDSMHSLIQAKGIDGILVQDCCVYSKNGLNFNNSTKVIVEGCTVDVNGYAVRFGESSGGVGAAETYSIRDCVLKSANDDGDAVIILRGTADNSTLTLENTTLVGAQDKDIPNIDNSTTGAKVIVKGEDHMEILLGKGEYVFEYYTSSPSKNLTITGQGDVSKISFKNSQVNLQKFDSLTINNCEILRMATKTWGHLVFASSVEGGEYTISNCIFNGVGTQGIYINQYVAATFNIVGCTFDGDFGGEGAITIQNNDGVNITVNVEDCNFNNIPATSHEICMLYAYDGLTLKASGVDVYWKPPVSVSE